MEEGRKNRSNSRLLLRLDTFRQERFFRGGAREGEIIGVVVVVVVVLLLLLGMTCLIFLSKTAQTYIFGSSMN